MGEAAQEVFIIAFVCTLWGGTWTIGYKTAFLLRKPMEGL